MPSFDLELALAAVFDGLDKLAQLRVDQGADLVLSPMVPTAFGEFRFGSSSTDSMTTTSAEVGLIGMGGNDTLIGGAEDNIFFGDYFDVVAFYGEVPYDYSVVGNDLLYGGIGNDNLAGGPGSDTLYGGDGYDTFGVHEESVAVESYYGGGEYDRLFVSRNWSNDQFTEIRFSRLILAEANSVELLTTDINIGGTDGADIFDMSGLTEYENATFDVGQLLENGYFDLHGGNDRFTGCIQAESVEGGYGNDTLIGNGGNDTLLGQSGNDSLVGGKGSDLYGVDSGLDTVEERAGQGIDLVKSTASAYTLGANVENLTNTGSAGFKGTGNSLKNTISGNNFNDTLNGGLGNDTLSGFGGNDAFVFNTALGSSNVDTITDFKPGFDLIHLENTGTGLFNKIRAGELTEAAFKITTPQSAVDADDRIIYNAATGRLIYDADGSGSGVGITFAFLTPNLALTAGDFLVI